MSVVSILKCKHTRTGVWFGRCSSKYLVMTYERLVTYCPLCKHELEKARYYGSLSFQYDSLAPDYKRSVWLPLLEDGIDVWQVFHEKGWNG